MITYTTEIRMKNTTTISRYLYHTSDTKNGKQFKGWRQSQLKWHDIELQRNNNQQESRVKQDTARVNANKSTHNSTSIKGRARALSGARPNNAQRTKRDS